MILLIDNFDSFTFNLVDYFNQLGCEVHVVRNNVPLEEIKKHTYHALVLGPGPETPARAGILMEAIDYYHDKLPILGVCLGHQALGEYFGARLVKGLRPMHGKISTIHTRGQLLFHKIPTPLKVVRYNSLVITDLPGVLKETAKTDEGENMAFRHVRLPIAGVQFHPEAALTEYGLRILQNWLDYYAITLK
jgi:anthranilate synthase component 2